jgi:hypothetical protein
MYVCDCVDEIETEKYLYVYFFLQHSATIESARS